MPTNKAVLGIGITIIVLVVVYAIIILVMYFTKKGLFVKYTAPPLKNGGYVYGAPVPLTSQQISERQALSKQLPPAT
jgi:hypothetical protein